MKFIFCLFFVVLSINNVLSDEINGLPDDFRPVLENSFRPPLPGSVPQPFLPTGRRPICTYQYRCSDDENVQWATDGFNCFVFRNECHLASTNCDRRNRFVKILVVVDKSDCQRLCRDICPEEFRPVCAIYNNKQRTFQNTCSLASHVCQTGETYNVYRGGECPNERRLNLY